MINLRYHIVSLTAVFLAIGIGLTLGSTFLDRATVDNFDAQLDNLQTRLEDREDRIGELQDDVDEQAARDVALDEQGDILLTDRLEGVPTVVLSARGLDEADVQATIESLVVASADVQGVWWLTERWRLDDDGEISDLAAVLDEDSTDPSRLRRAAIDVLGDGLRDQQLLGADSDPDATDPGAADPDEADPDGTDPEVPDADGEPVEDTPTTTTTSVDDETPDGPTLITLVRDLVDTGFIEFEALPGGPEEARFPDGTRLLVAAGSPDVPDDLMIEPLLARMGRATDVPVLAVLTSALQRDGGVSDAVLVAREDESLRELVSTVDTIEHFQGRAAAVLALADLGAGTVGHYGLDESASRLLPPVSSP